jgi:hypothetical protein
MPSIKNKNDKQQPIRPDGVVFNAFGQMGSSILQDVHRPKNDSSDRLFTTSTQESVTVS